MPDERPDLHLLTPAPPASDSGRIPDDDETAGEGDTETLSPREALLCDALAAGQTLAQAATSIGLSERSARRWKSKPHVAEGIRARLSENVSIGRAVLCSGMARASRALVNMSDGTVEASAPRVSAARAVVETTAKLVELEDVQTRLSELEAAIASQPGAGGFNRKGF